MNKITQHLISFVVLISLMACAPRPAVIVEERQTVVTPPVVVHQDGQRLRSGTRSSSYTQVRTTAGDSDSLNSASPYVVRANDTLYSIAFANQMSVDDLSCWNGISDSRTLQIGAELILIEPKPKPNCKPLQAPLSVGTAVARSESQSKASKPSSSRQTQSKPTPKSRPKAKPVSVWHWPLEGKLLERFSKSARRQGIVVSSPQNTPIKATARGTVVYRGNALKGYGNLLILNHAGEYLSAYAHTQEILVKEGQEVSAQEVVATTGRDNQNRTALHFQIRKNGSPVDPLQLLKR